MNKAIERITKLLVILVFIGGGAAFLYHKSPEFRALVQNPADVVTNEDIAKLGEQIANGGTTPAVNEDVDLNQALEAAKGLKPANPGLAPREVGDGNLKKAIETADIQELTKAVAAELARQNFVATEIKRNPAVIAQAIVLWGKEQQGALVPEIKDGEIDPALLSAALDEKGGVVLGDHETTYTIIVFTDPNCPHCRVAIPQLLAWIDREPKARILFREFPVIAEQSQGAARVALALGAQGLYRGWLEAVADWKGGVLDGAAARAIAEKLGADMTRLDAFTGAAETTKAIADSLQIGADLQIDGTPAMIFGRKLVIGSASTDWIADYAAQQGGPMPARQPAAPDQPE